MRSAPPIGAKTNTTSIWIQVRRLASFISDDELRERGELLFKSGYGAYLLGLLDGWRRAP